MRTASSTGSRSCYDPAAQTLPARAAVALEAVAAIPDAFRSHQFVGIGDANGNILGEAVANDILVAGGNSRYPEVVDRFIVTG